MYLETQGTAPPEYVDLVLCRDVYHCPPSELDRQDASTVLAHLVCLSAEEDYRKRKENK